MKECPSIPRLLSPGRPPTILRFIISVIIDAINRKARWARPHICEKRLETAPPSSAHLNPPAAIVFVISRIRIAASLNHAGPSAIFDSFAPIAGMAMRQLPSAIGQHVAEKAAAACNVATAEIGRNCEYLIAALASTFPYCGLIPPFGGEPNHKESTESLVYQTAYFGVLQNVRISMPHPSVVVHLAKTTRRGWSLAICNAAHGCILYAEAA